MRTIEQMIQSEVLVCLSHLVSTLANGAASIDGSRLRAGEESAHELGGEKVDKDFAGMCVWARTTSGQGIASDGVIERIYAELAK